MINYYEKYKKYKIKYNYITKPYKNIINNINLNKQDVKEIYENYFYYLNNLNNIKSSNNEYEYKYKKYKSKYNIIKHILNGGESKNSNTCTLHR